MRKIILAAILCLTCGLSEISAAKEPNKKSKPQLFLTWDQLIKLPLVNRANYLRDVAALVSGLENGKQKKPATKQKAFLYQFLIEPAAFAAVFKTLPPQLNDSCLKGGLTGRVAFDPATRIPVCTTTNSVPLCRGKVATCGAGLSLCNPLLYGYKTDNMPLAKPERRGRVEINNGKISAKAGSDPRITMYETPFCVPTPPPDRDNTAQLCEAEVKKQSEFYVSQMTEGVWGSVDRYRGRSELEIAQRFTREEADFLNVGRMYLDLHDLDSSDRRTCDIAAKWNALASSLGDICLENQQNPECANYLRRAEALAGSSSRLLQKIRDISVPENSQYSGGNTPALDPVRIRGQR